MARAVLRGTDFIFKIALQKEKSGVGRLRGFLLPRLIRIPFLQRQIFKTFSEVAIARKEIAR